MSFQEKVNTIEWRVHFNSPVEKVYNFLSTDIGRSKFWAEETIEEDGYIKFSILNYPTYNAKIIERIPKQLFKLEYFGTDVCFKLNETDNKETDLHLVALTPNENVKIEMTAGWVSVLMAMKAAVDFDVDLRNHHPKRTWENGYLDN